MIDTLSLILSCGCNLSCEYCLIAKAVNENSETIQKATKQALIDNSFLHNCQQTLKKINIDPKQIKYIQFWGQEPTLNLHLYTEKIKEWHNVFSNIESYMFSTNAKAYPEKIISFLIELDKYAQQNTYVEIQFSYDGDFSNNNLRKIDQTLVTSNINFVFNKLNQLNFKNINIGIEFNGVLSRVLTKELNTLDKINDYITKGKEWINHFVKLNQNPKVSVGEFMPMSPEVPYKCSIEDGVLIKYFYYLLKTIDKDQSLFMAKSFLRGYDFTLRKIQESGFENTTMLENLKLLINNISNQNNDPLYQILTMSSSCSPYFGSLKIMYDGTLLECHNLIFDTKKEYMKTNNKEEKSIKYSLIDKKRIINLLDENNQEVIEKVLYIGEQSSQYSFFSTFNETINLIYMLSLNGQADKEYLHNYDKLLLHAFILTRIDTCIFNRRITTGSEFFVSAGQIRFFCNGFLDMIIDKDGNFIYE